jgi:hypothetical protein
MLLPKLGGSWLLPPWDFPQLYESHPMDHDSVSSGHANGKDATPWTTPWIGRAQRKRWRSRSTPEEQPNLHLTLPTPPDPLVGSQRDRVRLDSARVTAYSVT